MCGNNFPGNPGSSPLHTTSPTCLALVLQTDDVHAPDQCFIYVFCHPPTQRLTRQSVLSTHETTVSPGLGLPTLAEA